MTDAKTQKLVSANLRRLRGDQSQYSVAKRSGTSQGAIRDIEMGNRMPSIGLLVRIADALDATVEDFLQPVRRRNGHSR